MKHFLCRIGWTLPRKSRSRSEVSLLSLPPPTCLPMGTKRISQSSFVSCPKSLAKELCTSFRFFYPMMMVRHYWCSQHVNLHCSKQLDICRDAKSWSLTLSNVTLGTGPRIWIISCITDIYIISRNATRAPYWNNSLIQNSALSKITFLSSIWKINLYS